MRAWAWTVVATIGVVLGTIQGIAAIALRTDATPASLPALVPRGLANVVDAYDPALPLTPTLRLVFARRALAVGDLARAAAETARLAPSRDRFALEARLAAARGDTAASVASFLAAGDLEGLESRVDELANEHRFPQALALERAMIARLRGDRTQNDAVAQASFHVGRLEEAEAYDARSPVSARRTHERRALDAYVVAVRLSPLSQQNLLALGNQQLNVGDLAGAVRTFERARDSDPTSADAILGLGDAAIRRGDRASARAYLARGRALAPNSEAADRLARKIDP